MTAEYEADPRQVERLLEDIDRAGEGVKGVVTPSAKPLQHQIPEPQWLQTLAWDRGHSDGRCLNPWFGIPPLCRSVVVPELEVASCLELQHYRENVGQTTASLSDLPTRLPRSRFPHGCNLSPCRSSAFGTEPSAC